MSYVSSPKLMDNDVEAYRKIYEATGLDFHSDPEASAVEWNTIEHRQSEVIGRCNWQTRTATIYAVEAARMMCCGSDHNPHARTLLGMALEELNAV